LHSLKLADELGTKISVNEAAENLKLLAEIIIEHYQLYGEYKHTTIHSDYGDRLHMLLDFIRLLARYRRIEWHLLPIRVGHSVLVRFGREEAARLWEAAVARRTDPLARELLEQLRNLEAQHGFRLQSLNNLFNQRFVHELAVERACSLIEPVLTRREPNWQAALKKLEQQIDQFAAAQPGTGLEPPNWLARLQHEAASLRYRKEHTATLTAEHFKVPHVTLTWQQVTELAQRQAGPQDDNGQ